MAQCGIWRPHALGVQSQALAFGVCSPRLAAIFLVRHPSPVPELVEAFLIKGGPASDSFGTCISRTRLHLYQTKLDPVNSKQSCQIRRSLPGKVAFLCTAALPAKTKRSDQPLIKRTNAGESNDEADLQQVTLLPCTSSSFLAVSATVPST